MQTDFVMSYWIILRSTKNKIYLHNVFYTKRQLKGLYRIKQSEHEQEKNTLCTQTHTKNTVKKLNQLTKAVLNSLKSMS